MHSFVKFLGISALCVFSLCGCRSVRYVSVESVHDTIVKIKDVYHASMVHDSVYIKEYTKGDTVYRDRWHRTILNDTIRSTDTLFITKNDTIRVPVEVGKKSSWWERNAEEPLQSLLYTILVCLVAYGVVRLIQRFKK